MFKVFYVSSGYQGCYYVRCFLPLMANGWKGSHKGLSKKSAKDPNLIMREMLDSDIIVFHRANTNWHHRMGMILKEQGKKIVFDNDDTFKLEKNHAFFSFDEKGFEENKEKLNNVVNNFIINSDLVTCSTDFLNKEYRELNKNVITLPNCVNPDDWPDTPLKNDTDKVRIGLVGSVAYHQDFEGIQDVIRKLDEDNRVQLVLFGLWKNRKREENPLVEKIHKNEYAFWDTLKNLEHAPWCEMEDYFYTLDNLKLDIMLIPRDTGYFNKCKSNIKFLEASMLEIPVIAQGFENGPYQELNGLNGIRIDNNNDWEKEIEKLIVDKEKRQLIGKEAKKYVLSKYNINDNAHLWVEAYKTL